MKLLHISASPHMRAEDTTRTIMLDVLIALTPALIWAVYIFGWRSLALTLLSVAACVFFEGMYQKLMKKVIRIGDLSAAVTGVLLAFNLPVSAPYWLVIIGAFFAIVVVKQLFGGIGKNFMNPALGARIFLFVSWPSYMTGYSDPFNRLPVFAMSPEYDAVSSATPLSALGKGAVSDIPLVDMLLGNTAGTIGEVSALLLIAGGLYLLARRVITWHIPVSFIGTVALITYFLPPSDTYVASTYMLTNLLSGATMLGAIFMATDYATSPVTKKGRIIFGVGCGLITVFIRYFGSYAEGVSFAITVMNLFVYYLDKYTKPVVFGGVHNGKA